MANTSELQWGLRMDHECRAAWGARALYGRIDRKIDLLPDRQDCKGDETDMELLFSWLNHCGGLRRMRELVRAERLCVNERREVRIDGGYFHCVANPNGSHGYLYITAYMD